jgi:oligopeptide transport system substrate-binding protein
MLRILPIAALLVLLGGCSGEAEDGRIDVSIIGDRFRQTDPDRATMTAADRMLASATAEGLVAFDENGQVEPALAESWIVTPDGLSTIFRVRAVEWPGGVQVSGEDAATALRASVGKGSRNAYAPLLTAVGDVMGMTGRVIEVRLKTPRPNLLQLLAQPEFSIRRGGTGIGRYKVARFAPLRVRLMPNVGPDDPPADYEPVVLRTERAARAIVRFEAGDAELVAGGTFADWPYVRAATPRPGRLRFDPVQGLFGLAVVGRSTFLGTSDVRQALAMAIDRRALADAFGLSGWSTTDNVLPARLDSAESPAVPDWSGSSLVQRRADAAARVFRWRAGARTPPVLRIALPQGPGTRVLLARLATDWGAIGVRITAVSMTAKDADLRLIDAVAPNTSANWYLTSLSCAAGLACDGQGDVALEASRAAPTLALRSARIAEADAVLAQRASFIPLGTPLRWSLVNPRLTGWKENAMGAHPLHRLRPIRVSQY